MSDPPRQTRREEREAVAERRIDGRPTVAWFSPLPPDRSGIAAYSAELLDRLGQAFHIDTYPERRAHEFVWRGRRQPYDLVVYQMGNSRAHDYMWAYLPRYPGLVVLHDARLHHARAAHLLSAGRVDDYRAEFAFNHPDVRPEAAEYAVEGLSGSIYYFWPMLRSIVSTARLVAVHNPWVARDLAQEYPEAPLTVVRMGVPPLVPSTNARARLRAALSIPDGAIAFAVFGKVTAEKRIPAILRAVHALIADGVDVRVMLIGDADGYPSLAADAAALGIAARVRIAGFVDDRDVADYLEAADACLCLRWPTAKETSASWLRCLVARRATIISGLAHLADVPENVALRVDLLEEDESLLAAMRRLAVDARLRAAVADAGHRYWSEHHTLEAMADDYRRLLPLAAARAAPAPRDLPRHLTRDYSESARALLARFGLGVDLFG
jgi:glycosyltransferase involved in cell wall biosynthesis